MLSLDYIVSNLDTVIKQLSNRGGDFSYLKSLVKLDQKRRLLIIEGDSIKNKRNVLSKEIGNLKRQKQDATKILNEVNGLGEQIKEIDVKLASIDSEIRDILLITPNLPNATTPVGKDENNNVEIKRWGKTPSFKFPVKDHLALAEGLNLLDVKRASKVSGSRFTYYIGLGARLERALINFMLDEHIKRGYTEALPPYLVKFESMVATGQFPKFKEDAFKIDGSDLCLNPTAEVPMINYYRGEILDGKQLPVKFCAYSAAFRQEAGSAGKDTRGIIRQHQFNKVELIKFTTPESSYNELDLMVKDACHILEDLKLPYRVITLCTGDLGFSMAKTHDIEVWLPSENRYREISSVSNAEDYQARRGQIRYRDSEGKTQFLHTLNGSGLAVGRTLVAILENYQQADGSIKIPDVLVPYMLGVTKISKE